MPKVRYTAARSGLKTISVYPFGQVSVGDVLDVSDAQAARFLAQHPTRDYGTAEDTEARWTREELDVIARDHGLDPSQFKKKGELAQAVWDIDKTSAGQVHRSDFEAVADSEKANVAAFGDKVAEATAAPAADSVDEGVTNG